MIGDFPQAVKVYYAQFPKGERAEMISQTCPSSGNGVEEVHLPQHLRLGEQNAAVIANQYMMARISGVPEEAAQWSAQDLAKKFYQQSVTYVLEKLFNPKGTTTIQRSN